jgi:hypothetical protein
MNAALTLPVFRTSVSTSSIQRQNAIVVAAQPNNAATLARRVAVYDTSESTDHIVFPETL